MGEPPESSDRDRLNRGDSESSSSSWRQGETGGLEQGLGAGLWSMGLDAAGLSVHSSVAVATGLGLWSTSMGMGLWLRLGQSSSSGSGAGLGL